MKKRKKKEKKKKKGEKPVQCVGLKFFNVYGPNEFHKGEMRSLILKMFEKLKKRQKVFESVLDFYLSNI